MAVYATSDWHGYYTFYKQVKQFLKPEDKIIFCGDAIDRGPSSWKLLTALMDDPQFYCLMGNHEDMLCQVADQYWKYYAEDKASAQLNLVLTSSAYQQYLYNGGLDTWHKYRRATKNKDWLNRIKELPLGYEYTNAHGETFYISHAGCDFTDIDKDKSQLDLLWNRQHFMTEKSVINKNLYIIHGHTPIQYFKKYGIKYDAVQSYNQGHKINLDCGTVASKEILLYNLDNHCAIRMKAEENK